MTSEAHEKYYRLYERERIKIEKRLTSLLNNKQPVSLYEPCAYILRSGGKRLRALLVLLTAQITGAKFSQVYNAAMAVEILHNFTLIHDDIMDNADKRRGLQTLHKKYDISTAILAGDNLIAVAYNCLLRDCKSEYVKVFSAFTKGVIEVCEGQSLDKEFETRGDVSIKEYMNMITKKTAALAEACCEIGALLGGGNKREITALKKYGINLGIAFQLQDDLLDIIGEEKEFGKSVGGDLIEGKKTYLFLKALQKAEGRDKEDLIKVIKNNGIQKSQVKKYRNIYLKLGIIEDTKKEVEKYTQYALKAINDFENSDSKNALIWLANVLNNRSK